MPSYPGEARAFRWHEAANGFVEVSLEVREWAVAGGVTLRFAR